MFPSGPWFFDLAASHALQSIQSGWLTAVMKFITVISTPEIQVAVIVLAAIGFWLKGIRRHDSLVVTLIMAGNAITLAVKFIAGRSRPSADLVHVLIHETGHSFPSGHALGAMLLAGGAVTWAFLHHWRSRWFWLFVGGAYALLVGISRVYLGVHWATDVLAGYLFSAVWIAVVMMIERKYFLPGGIGK